VLARRGLVDVWSDARIRAGADWQKAIDTALSSAKVAVLRVSPAFLASEFIWEREMPRIVAHLAQGMEALPLIVRPCAWTLEDDLVQLQAWPTDGRAKVGKSPAATVTSVNDRSGVARSFAVSLSG
jgi:TIR domain-containing protein